MAINSSNGSLISGLESELGKLVDLIQIFFFTVSYITAFIQLYNFSYKSSLFLTNFIFASVVMMLWFMRKKVHINIKVIFLFTIILYNGVSAIWDNGLLSTGFMNLIVLLLLLVIFFKKIYSIFYLLLLSVYLICLVFLVVGGYHTYNLETVDQLNRLNQWFPYIATFLSISIVITIYLHKLKDRLMHRESELKKLAFYDPVTGIFNKTRFFMEFDKKSYIKDRKGFLIVMNITRFRVLSSLLGQRRTDRILELIASAVTAYKLPKTILGKLDQGEFILWFPSISKEYLEERLKGGILEISDGIKDEFNDLSIELHFGVVSYPHDGDDIYTCYEKCKLALQVAEDTTHETIVYYKDTMHITLSKELQLKRGLEDAIENSTIDIYYQTKVDPFSNKILGVEALSRWKDDAGEYISPDLFIPIIKKYNMMVLFGCYTLKRVFYELPLLYKKYGENIKVSINISPELFLTADLTHYLETYAKTYSVNLKNIVLEITEDVFIDDIYSVTAKITEIKAIGCSISLDDFGTGFSSLSYLSSIEFDELKIDKSFIQNIATDKKQHKLVLSIMQIAKALNLSLVAEGVETDEQLDKLKEMGCDLIQGYIYSRPEPVEK